ncbi:MAG: Dabb family protein [Bacteroidales bacterium]|nr:Dabb family protein [Bacteroidales bacterium]
MVRYCVMWKFKPSDGKTSKELAEDVKEKYESLLGLVPGLTSIEIGINRNEGKTSYDAVMIADFESWEALATYKADTMRDNIIEYVKTIAEVRAKVEYER